MIAFWGIANAAIEWNCRTLSVPIPRVRIAETSELATPTTKCAVSSDGKELLISRAFAEGKADEPFVWLALSHECRHIWQALHADLFDDYQASSEASMLDYNRQAAEIDAWAWGVIVLSERFHSRPTLEKNFGDDVWRRINDRAEKITKEGLY